MTDRGSITVDQFLAHPPETVWRALTDPLRLAEWLMPNDFRPVVGHRFTFRTAPRPAHDFDGIIHCEVLSVDPPYLLRISWQGGALDTTVTWILRAEGSGTRLFVEHKGFDPDDPRQAETMRRLGSGWRSHVLRSLALHLAGGRGTRRRAGQQN